MCGIWGCVPFTNLQPRQIIKLFESFMNVQKRGPDRSTFIELNDVAKLFLGFHRLSIMDTSMLGDQPFKLSINDMKTENKSIYSLCNGEIYNYKQLIKQYNLHSLIKSSSDCECLPHLYNIVGFKSMLQQLRGEFALCIVEINHINKNVDILLGRDQLGVRPIFFGMDNNCFAFSSILNGIISLVNPRSIRQMGRAEIINLKLNNGMPLTLSSNIYHTFGHNQHSVLTYNNQYIRTGDIKVPQNILKKIRDTLIDSVNIRMSSDKQIGALLSGGFDSSITVAIASQYLKQHNIKLHTFSIGIPGSTDKKYAEMVSAHCSTIHTHVEFTEAEFLGAIEHVIQATETYDITTVRASTGQYLISKWISINTNIKVLLIGDGADEVCSGYMYFHNAPDAKSSHNENIRLVENIYLFDALRADRCIAYNGLEARVPFLDHHFVDMYLSLPCEYRTPQQENNGRKVEKWLLRKSFDTNNLFNQPFLPEAVLWRMKEAFSDGVSSQERSWFHVIQENIESIYTEEDFKNPAVVYHIKPTTKEALHYRNIFNRLFHPDAAHIIPYYWMPKWSGNVNDPSARVLSVYKN